MKPFYLSIPIVFLFFIGCSTTSKLTNYPTQESFYEDINNSIKNEEVKVVTVDSSFLSSVGSIIKGDSLQTTTKIKEENISLQDVKEIKYYGKAHKEPSAYVLLANGKELRAENIQKLPNSIIQLRNISINSGYVPINKVKEISYKTKWQSTLVGAPLGFLGGAVVGVISGATGIFPHISGGGNNPTFDPATSGIVGAFMGAIVGTVAGTVVGYLIGWDHIYQFNP